MPRIVLAAALALIAVLTSCSSGSPSGAGPTTPFPSDSASTAAPASGATSSSSSPAATNASSTPSSPATAAPTATPPAGARIPAPGEYVYTQQGSETLCSTTACGTPRPLPNQMHATVTYTGRVAGTDAMTLAFRIAEGRTIRIDARFSDPVVTLHRFDAAFTEAGITQARTIAPAPPISLLKFPLSAGKRWSGTFADGDARGDYAFRAVALETINAGGSRVRAWKVDGTIEASGDGEASIALTLWVDPDTRTFMRIAGSIDATYDFARYKATFTDTLSTSPR